MALSKANRKAKFDRTTYQRSTEMITYLQAEPAFPAVGYAMHIRATPTPRRAAMARAVIAVALHWHTTGNKKGKWSEMKKNAKDNSTERGGYDPYKRDPGAGMPGDERVEKAEEMEARQREKANMLHTDRLDDSTTSPIIDTGITGQTTRGSYGFNDSTGQGQYMDRTRDGSADVGVDPVDQASDHFGSNEAAEDDATGPGEEEER